MKYYIIVLISTLLFYRATSQSLKKDIHRYEADTALSWKYLLSGERKYKFGSYADALADFKMAINYNHRNEKALRLKGNSEHHLEQYDSAIKSYTKALAINASDVLSYKGRAESLRYIENCEDALKDYDRAILLDSKDLELFFGRGSCAFASGLYDLCISDMSIYLAQRPGPRAHFFRGSAYASINKFHEAVNDLTKYIDEDGEMQGAYYFRGTAYTILSNENISNADSAIADLKKFISSVPDNASAYKFLGIAYSVKRDSLSARRYFKQALTINPDDGQIYYSLGNLELVWGYYSKAVELYNMALTKEPIEQLNDLLCQSALAKAGLKDTLGALTDFAKSLKVDSNYLKTYEKRINLIGAKRRYAKLVIHDLTKMIWLRGLMNPEDTITLSYLYSQRGVVHANTGNKELAKADEDKAVSLTPKYFYSYLMRAFVGLLLKSEDNTSILGDIEKSVSLETEKWESYFLKAIALDNFDDKSKEKCECIKKAIKLGGAITKEIEDYYCKGKRSKKSNALYTFYIDPHLKKVLKK